MDRGIEVFKGGWLLVYRGGQESHLLLRFGCSSVELDFRFALLCLSCRRCIGVASLEDWTITTTQQQQQQQQRPSLTKHHRQHERSHNNTLPTGSREFLSTSSSI